MSCILLMFLVFKAHLVSPAPSCPVSCAVCSTDAVICQRLAHIIDAAGSTQALLLTEGSISTVQPSSLSDLRNVTVIGLSNNHISELNAEAFRNLPFLHTLLLDHNLLSSLALEGGALTNLSQLEVLALGHNLISTVQADWFKGTKTLMSLRMEGNLLTSLESGSFPLRDFRDLESLDLSDNLITYFDRYSFRGLVSLKILDLSRNRLSSAPAEAFSYLTWLTNLNLDLNSWNCSCELLELAAVLSSFIQQPDKTLYNGRRMVCVSADNPAVTTVLELTEANCVPSNQNITVQVERRGGVSPHLYARDLTIAAVFCFIGGVALTLIGVLIYYLMSRRKNTTESQGMKEEGQSSEAKNTNVGERRRDVIFRGSSSQEQLNKEGFMYERTDRHIDQARSRAEGKGYSLCHNCNMDGKLSSPMRKDDWQMNGGIRGDEDTGRRRFRMMMEEERRRSLSGRPHREISELWSSSKMGKDVGNHSLNADLTKIRSFQSHKMHKPPKNSVLKERIGSTEGEREAMEITSAGMKRGKKNVRFDQRSPRTSQHKDSLEEAAFPRDKERRGEGKAQSSRLLKVKLNLNPLKKSKIHPRKKDEKSNTDRRRSRRSKENMRHGKERKEEEEDKSEKRKKSSKSIEATKVAKKVKEEEQNGGEEQKSPEVHQSKTTNSEDPSAVRAQQQNLLAFQYPAQVSQNPFAFFAADKNRSTNLSLLGSGGSLQTAGGVSLQAGNTLLNNKTLMSGAFLPAAPSSFSAPGGASSGLSMASVGPGRIMSSGPIPLDDPLRTGQIHRAPPPSAQTEVPSAGLANPDVKPPVSQLPPDVPPLVAAPKRDPAQGQSTQAKSEAPVSTEALPEPAGEDQMSGLTSPPHPETRVENISNNNSQAESRTAGAVVQTEGPTVRGSGEHMKVDGPAASESSPRSTRELVQQEYVSDEGGSSPRRRLRLVLPEKTSSRPPTALERKIR